MDKTYFSGHDGFVWFFGDVVDRNDPKELGRVRVRPYGVYGNVPVSDLPWALCIQSITSSATEGVGISPTGMEVGSVVFGFFVDGKDSQQPVIVGTYAGNNDIHKLVLGTDTGIANSKRKNVVIHEPEPSYAAKYPHNKVTVSESGHVIEIDDTPDAERLHVFHKSGSYHEIQPSGIMIAKSIDDHFVLSQKDMYLGAGNNVHVNATNYTKNIINTSETTASVIKNTASNSYTIKGGTVDVRSDGTVTISGGNITVQGPVTFQGNVDVLGSSFKWNGQTVHAG